jgi:hypothetical protein
MVVRTKLNFKRNKRSMNNQPKNTHRLKNPQTKNEQLNSQTTKILAAENLNHLPEQIKMLC